MRGAILSRLQNSLEFAAARPMIVRI